eukprot:TRINITY_DN7511_c0_g2_i8.p1 TRINITY_DN7511_c0_g2~~TRINITY_DN7511_c0_g2_i8.p1  ORF type:complete len:284 (-),score=42.92 TRINITY_DN7511_c0_g2_i8:130-981(-)
MVLYLIWIRFDQAPNNGKGRRIEFVRRMKWWHFFRDYFPIYLHKMVDLDPQKNYVFGCHPHGILSIGPFTNLATEATGWSKKFPGIKVNLCTLPIQFNNPFWREFLLALGLCNSSRGSIVKTLQRGLSVAIVIGGAQESLASRPGTADLTLKKRKGFVKIALEEGASLVPIFSFGETDLWDQVENPPGSFTRKVQDYLKETLTFTLPLLSGRGVFQYSYGLLPHRRPIHTVVGKPIHLPKIDNPSSEDIDKWHSLYMKGLVEVYETYKDEYAKDRKSDLKFIE